MRQILSPGHCGAEGQKILEKILDKLIGIGYRPSSVAVEKVVA
jgi:hypothetical protein